MKLTETLAAEHFAQQLWNAGYRKIYLSHYENETEARRFADVLIQYNFKVTVASDARKLGEDFVKKCIDETDLTIVIDPDSHASNMILRSPGGAVINITL